MAFLIPVIAAISDAAAAATAITAADAAVIGGGIDLATAGVGTAIGTGAASSIAAASAAAGATAAAAGGSLLGDIGSAALGVGGSLGSALLSKPKVQQPALVATPAPPAQTSGNQAAASVYAQTAQTAGRASTVATSGLGALLLPASVQQKTLLGS